MQQITVLLEMVVQVVPEAEVTADNQKQLRTQVLQGQPILEEGAVAVLTLAHPKQPEEQAVQA